MNVGSLRVGSSPCLNREKTFAYSLPIECWLLRSSIGHMAICIQKDLNLILMDYLLHLRISNFRVGCNQLIGGGAIGDSFVLVDYWS